MRPSTAFRGACALALLAGALAACHRAGGDAAAAFDESALPAPTDPVLALGQRVYRGDCHRCHDVGKKGAPRIADAAAWRPRLNQGMDTLVQHALHGFSGPTGSEMPERGGNDALTDAEVAAAVRYLTSHVH